MSADISPEALAAEIARLLHERSGGAIADVIAERRRQIEVEGWTPEHDDTHSGGCLARAASCYALHAGWVMRPRAIGWPDYPPHGWPFDREWWKPKDPRRDLVRAAALIIAEIERLDRLAAAREPEEAP